MDIHSNAWHVPLIQGFAWHRKAFRYTHPLEVILHIEIYPKACVAFERLKLHWL